MIDLIRAESISVDSMIFELFKYKQQKKMKYTLHLMYIYGY